MEKIPDFNDLIFESRNKKYGAYKLRKSNSRILTVSNLIGVLIALCATLIPFQIQKTSVNRIIADARNAILIEMEDFVPPEEKIYVPPPPTKPLHSRETPLLRSMLSEQVTS